MPRITIDAAGGHADRLLHRGDEAGLVGDRLVGRRDDQHRVGAASAACRAAIVIAGAVLRPVGSSSTVVAAAFGSASSRSCSSTRKRCSSLPTTQAAPTPISSQASAASRSRSLLEQAAVTLQHQELLRVHRARQRPQPGAAAAGDDHGMDEDGMGVMEAVADSKWGVKTVQAAIRSGAGMKPCGLSRCQRQLSAHIASRSTRGLPAEQFAGTAPDRRSRRRCRRGAERRCRTGWAARSHARRRAPVRARCSRCRCRG